MHLSKLLFILILFLLSSSLIAQTELPPKYEFRAVWITTVYNNDYPSRAGLSTEKQKEEMREMLDMLAENNFNAVFFQVRSEADAFYPSPYEPWSRFLTGRQGQVPNPFWDPLAFAIEESHKRGIEFHAWLNPYRAVINVQSDSSKLTRQHPIFKKPKNWFVQYGKKLLFNPGIPAVREYLTEVVMDIVRNYDLDGIHFDDYFYPYQIQGEVFNDRDAFSRYNLYKRSLADWRRENVDKLIQAVHDSIQIENPQVKFGVSPGGVWRNKSDDPDGSDTRAGQPTYDYLYADPLKWLEEGWIDYVCPQIYWSIGHSAANFGVLVPWWAEHCFDRHVYVGHALYKVTDDNYDNNWKDPSQIPEQIQLLRTFPEIKGSAYFRTAYLERNVRGVLDSLSQKYYAYPALIPPMTWKDGTPPQSPENLQVEKFEDRTLLQWQESSDTDLKYFVVYRFEKGEEINLDNVKKIIGTSSENIFEDFQGAEGQEYIYLITGLDRQHNESEATVIRVEQYGEKIEDTTLITSYYWEED